MNVTVETMEKAIVALGTYLLSLIFLSIFIFPFRFLKMVVEILVRNRVCETVNGILFRPDKK